MITRDFCPLFTGRKGDIQHSNRPIYLVTKRHLKCYIVISLEVSLVEKVQSGNRASVHILSQKLQLSVGGTHVAVGKWLHCFLLNSFSPGADARCTTFCTAESSGSLLSHRDFSTLIPFPE